MRLAYAFPASGAEFSSDGKLAVVGGDFDTIGASKFPAVHQHMALVVKLILQPLECAREHILRVELIDADGGKVFPGITVPFRAQPQPHLPHRRVGVGLVIHLQNVQFERPGDYAFHVLVDDLELETVPLYLVLHAPSGTEHAEKSSDEGGR